MFDRVRSTTHPLPTLDIPVHCMHGLTAGNTTEDHFLYDVDSFNASSPPAPTVIRMGAGDGTVNLKSLESCKRCVAPLVFLGCHPSDLCDVIFFGLSMWPREHFIESMKLRSSVLKLLFRQARCKA